MRIFDKFKQKIFIRLYLNLYRRISYLAIKLNDGISPKHRIMNYSQFFIDNIEKNSKVLDIGCSIGIIAYRVSDKAQKVVGIDISKQFIQIARENHNKENITYIVGDATKFEFEEIFDYVILSNVLEHIKNRINFLNQMKKFGNIFLIRVPLINRSWLPIYIKELGMDYRLSDDHYIEYTLETFQKEIESVGLKIITYSIQFGEIWAKIASHL